jgi:hypothetical protein
MKTTNNWVQATSGYALCLFLSRRPGAPDPTRSPMRMQRAIAASLLLLAAFAVTGGDLPTRKLSYDFIGMVVELTIDSMPDIHGMTISLRQTDGSLVKVLDKRVFKDWKGGVTRFDGIVHMGSDVDIITVATGTGTGMYYLHKYRIHDGGARLVKSERIYDWGLRPPKDELVTGKKKGLVLKQDRKNPWNVHFDVE